MIYSFSLVLFFLRTANQWYTSEVNIFSWESGFLI